MKFVVVSNKTIERAIVENSIIGDMKSDKERELEKKQKEEELKKKEQKNKNKDNDVIVKPPKDDKTTIPPKDDKTTIPPKDDKTTTTTPPKDDKKTIPPKDDKTTTTTPPKDDKKTIPPKDDKTKTPETKTPPIVTDTDLSKTKEPPKPTNPSGKIIPKPKKPLMKNSPAAKAGIPIEIRQKKSNMNAAFQATKDKNSGYTKADFIKDFPNSQTAKKYRKGERIPGFKYPKKTKVKAEPPVNLKDMSTVSKPKDVTIDDFKTTPTPAPKKENIKSSYDPYDLVLDYVLSEGHASTVEEAHYVMMQMDEETIQTITEIKKRLIGSALLATPFVLQKVKDKFDPVGNKRKEFQDALIKKKEKQSGTEGQGYFN